MSLHTSHKSGHSPKAALVLRCSCSLHQWGEEGRFYTAMPKASHLNPYDQIWCLSRPFTQFSLESDRCGGVPARLLLECHTLQGGVQTHNSEQKYSWRKTYSATAESGWPRLAPDLRAEQSEVWWGWQPIQPGSYKTSLRRQISLLRQNKHT